MASRLALPNVTRNSGPALLALTSQVLQVVIGIFTIPVALSHLGSERFSLLATLFAMTFFTPLADLGMPRTVARISSSLENDERGGDAVSHLLAAVRLQLVIVVVLVPVVVLVLAELIYHGRIGAGISTGGSEAMIASVCFVFALGFQLIQNLFVAHIQGRGWLYRMAILMSISGVVATALPLLLLMPSANLVHVGIAYMLVRGMAMISAITIVMRSERNAQPERISAVQISCSALAAEGINGLIYFALAPVLVYGERYIAPFLAPGNNIAPHLVAVDACLRLLVVPGILSQYSFRALSQGISMQGAVWPVLNRYLSSISLLFVCPIILIGLFTPELVENWLGSSAAPEVVICIRMALVAVSSCAVSAFLVQLYIVTSKTGFLSRLAAAELLVYFSLVAVLLLFTLGWLQVALILTAVWSIRVVIEGLVMGVLISRDIEFPSLSPIWRRVMLYPIVAILIALVLEHSLPTAIKFPSKVALSVCFLTFYFLSVRYEKGAVAN